MQKIVQSLKSSPLFNLSLSSKELFHSNFLWWVFENNKEFVSRFFVDKFERKFGQLLEIKRENRNFDLSLIFEKSEIIIENKVKSIPNKEQLNKYQKKINENNLLCLLSVFKPANFEEYNFLGYDEIIKLITQILRGEKDKYKIGILTDYCSFIENLLLLTKAWKEIEIFDFHTRYDTNKNEENDYLKYNKIRMHDMYHKIKYHQFCEKLYAETNSLLEEKYQLHLKPFNYFSNGTGAASLWYFLEEKDDKVIRLELQVQDNMVRLMIISEKCSSIKEKLITNQSITKIYEIFNSENLISITEDKVYPKNGGFNKFGSGLIYRYKRIKCTDMKKIITELAFVFCEVVTFCEEDKNNIIQILRTN